MAKYLVVGTELTEAGHYEEIPTGAMGKYVDIIKDQAIN